MTEPAGEGRIYMRQLAPSDRKTANTWRLAGEDNLGMLNIYFVMIENWSSPLAAAHTN